jgi:arylsulfatase A-like enzyme
MARFANCITPCVVCQPARASILTGQLCRTHGVHDNGIDLDPATGAKGVCRRAGGRGLRDRPFRQGAFLDLHTFAPTGTPECCVRRRTIGTDWFGPYMGFDHVELMLVGHNWFLPEKPPAGQHYERWFYADGRGDEKNALYRENAGDTNGAAQTWHSQLPTGLAQLHLDRGPGHRLAASTAGAMRRSAPGSAFPIRIIPSTRPNPGRGCMTRPTSTCPRIAPAVL